MLERLAPRPGDRGLEIGTGSGYQTALLSAAGAIVFTVERIQELAEAAHGRLDELGYHGIHYRVGDGTLGWPGEAPFAGIIVSAGAPEFPRTLSDQLAENGRLVVPVGDEESQNLVVAEKHRGQIIRTNAGGCRFVKLIGEEGWKAEGR